MRRICGALAIGVLALAPLSAHGQQPGAPADSRASELIAQSSAEGVFEAQPSDQVIVVRHARSGLVCRLDPDNRNRLIIFPQAARGEDVACDSTDGTESVTLYATRLSFEVTPQQLIEGAVTAIRERFPDARELPLADAPDSPPLVQSAQFMVTRDGAPYYTRVTVALVGPWVIKLRYTLAAPDADAAQRGEAASNRIWNATLSELAQQPL